MEEVYSRRMKKRLSMCLLMGRYSERLLHLPLAHWQGVGQPMLPVISHIFFACSIRENNYFFGFCVPNFMLVSAFFYQLWGKRDKVTGAMRLD